MFFKKNTFRLFVASLLSASTVQVVAANLPPTGGEEVLVPKREKVTPVAQPPQRPTGYKIDFSDPVATFSKAGMGAGTEGVDVYAAIGGYLGGQYEHKLTVESKNDLDYYNVDYLVFNTVDATGITIDTSWYDDYDRAALGVVKKLQFDLDPNLFVYPAMKLGMMWDWDESISSTAFVELEVGFRYLLTPDLWLGATPNYTYGLNGEETKELITVYDVGYQVAETIGISAHINNDKEAWADITFAF